MRGDRTAALHGLQASMMVVVVVVMMSPPVMVMMVVVMTELNRDLCNLDGRRRGGASVLRLQ